MLIGGDDISNNVITCGICFSMFVYRRALYCFMLIGGNQKQLSYAFNFKHQYRGKMSERVEYVKPCMKLTIMVSNGWNQTNKRGFFPIQLKLNTH